MWAKRKHVGREEQVLALGCKSIVLKDGCQKDIRGALTVSVVFNNSCLIRLKCCLRLELGAFRSWADCFEVMITMRGISTYYTIILLSLVQFIYVVSVLSSSLYWVSTAISGCHEFWLQMAYSCPHFSRRLLLAGADGSHMSKKVIPWGCSPQPMTHPNLSYISSSGLLVLSITTSIHLCPKWYWCPLCASWLHTRQCLATPWKYLFTTVS